MQTSLQGISKRAKKDKEHCFGNLYEMLNEEYLKECFYELNKDAAAGVDGVDYYEYEKNLDGNIQELVKELKTKSYRAKLIRRQYIRKQTEN